MAKKSETYLNILDELLDHGVAESETEDARSRGDDLAALTQDMAEDGFFSSHVTASAESIRTVIAKKLSDDNVLDDITVSEGEAKSNRDGLASAANEAALLSAIDKLLSRGHSPAKIAAVLEKYAELNLWNKQFSTDLLNRRVNELGMSYLQPNTFMPKKPDTYESQKPKLGSVHVAIEGENLLGLNESKFGGQPAVQRRPVEVKVADRDESPSGNVPLMARVPDNQSASIRGAAAKTAAVRDRGADFDSGTVAKQHRAGKSFEQIWREACQTAGLHRASKAFNEYVNAAKRAGTKFAAAEVNFFRDTLGHKGVEVAAAAPRPISRIAYDSGKRGGTAKDGNELLQEFELSTSPASVDVELNDTIPFDVEAGKPEINIA